MRLPISNPSPWGRRRECAAQIHMNEGTSFGQLRPPPWSAEVEVRHRLRQKPALLEEHRCLAGEVVLVVGLEVVLQEVAARLGGGSTGDWGGRCRRNVTRRPQNYDKEPPSDIFFGNSYKTCFQTTLHPETTYQ